MNRNIFSKKILLCGIILLFIINIVSCSDNKVEISYLESEEKVQVKTDPNTWLSITAYDKDKKNKEDNFDYKLIHQGRTDEEGNIFFYVDLSEGSGNYLVRVNVEDKIFEEDINVGKNTSSNESKIKDGKVHVIVGTDGEHLVDKKGVRFKAGETALEIVERELEKEKVKFEIEDGMIVGVGGLENDEDVWTFNINGRKQNTKESNFELRDKDKIEIIYGETDVEDKDDKKENNLLDKDKIEPYINGYKDGSFRPTDNATREQVSSMIYKVMKDEVIEKNKTKDNDFKDIPDYKWSREFISTLSNMDIINGYKDSTFKPEANITRGEVAVIIGRVTGIDEVDDIIDFNDIEDYWGRGYVNAVAKEGWVQGYKTGEFRPNEAVTRAEFVTMLNNALERPDNPDAKNEFTDFNEDNWFYGEVIKASSPKK